MLINHNLLIPTQDTQYSPGHDTAHTNFTKPRNLLRTSVQLCMFRDLVVFSTRSVHLNVSFVLSSTRTFSNTVQNVFCSKQWHTAGQLFHGVMRRFVLSLYRKKIFIMPASNTKKGPEQLLRTTQHQIQTVWSTHPWPHSLRDADRHKVSQIYYYIMNLPDPSGALLNLI